MDILRYKDYEGTSELDMSRGVCRGKILFINDLVTYEADKPADLQKEFEAAVDDYLETCATVGRQPQKPCRGQFNVRVPPALHRSAMLRSIEDGISLNDVVVQSLGSYLNIGANVNHIIVATTDCTTIATASGSPQFKDQWGRLKNVH